MYTLISRCDGQHTSSQQNIQKDKLGYNMDALRQSANANTTTDNGVFSFSNAQTCVGDRAKSDQYIFCGHINAQLTHLTVCFG